MGRAQADAGRGPRCSLTAATHSLIVCARGVVLAAQPQALHRGRVGARIGFTRGFDARPIGRRSGNGRDGRRAWAPPPRRAPRRRRRLARPAQPSQQAAPHALVDDETIGRLRQLDAARAQLVLQLALVRDGPSPRGGCEADVRAAEDACDAERALDVLVGRERGAAARRRCSRAAAAARLQRRSARATTSARGTTRTRRRPSQRARPAAARPRRAAAWRRRRGRDTRRPRCAVRPSCVAASSIRRRHGTLARPRRRRRTARACRCSSRGASGVRPAASARCASAPAASRSSPSRAASLGLRAPRARERRRAPTRVACVDVRARAEEQLEAAGLLLRRRPPQRRAAVRVAVLDVGAGRSTSSRTALSSAPLRRLANGVVPNGRGSGALLPLRSARRGRTTRRGAAAHVMAAAGAPSRDVNHVGSPLRLVG